MSWVGFWEWADVCIRLFRAIGVYASVCVCEVNWWHASAGGDIMMYQIFIHAI